MVKKFIITFAIFLAILFTPAFPEEKYEQLRRTLTTISEIKQSQGEELTIDDIVNISHEIYKPRINFNSLLISIPILFGLITVATQLKSIIKDRNSEESLRSSKYITDIHLDLQKNKNSLKEIESKINSDVNPQIQEALGEIKDLSKDIEISSKSVAQIQEIKKELSDIVKKLNQDVNSHSEEIVKVKEDINKIIQNINVISEEILNAI